MTREEARHWLEIELKLWEDECKSEHPIKEALRNAIKASEENTVSEKTYTDEHNLRKDAELELYKSKKVIEFFKCKISDYPKHYVFTREEVLNILERYEERCRYHDIKPNEDEKNVETCYNHNEDYDDCDQFVCSECGIELQDWHRVEREDDGEISYHEYCFEFCPHCGRKIKSRYEKWTKNI